MKIKNGFLLRKVGEQSIVVATGDISRNFNGIIKLNETGEFLWRMLQKGANEDELISAMLIEYATNKNTVSADIGNFLNSLREADIIE